jgi:hypothetical protein
MTEPIHLTPALRMQGSHYRSAMGGPVERAGINAMGGLAGECIGKFGHEVLHLECWFFRSSHMVLLWFWRSGCCTECLTPWYTSLRWSFGAETSALTPLQPVCTSGRKLNNMPRKRGVPRRGSNWYARKEQRQRKEQLERALVIATSMLRQRARAEEKALLSTIAEKKTECSNLGSVNLEEQLYSGCIVEEELSPEDLSTMAAPSDRMEAGSGDEHHTFRMDDDLPGCIIEEETPWQSMDTPFAAEDAQGDVKQLENRSGGQEVEFEGGDMLGKQMENSSGGQEDEFDGGDMHGFLSREEHLSLLFELRGHMADLEHRALIMGQRLDILFDAHSGAPTRRRCPLCSQSFAIPAGSTWKTNEGDRSPVS